MQRCQFYLNESVIRWRAPRLSSLKMPPGRPMCKESCVVVRSPENTTCVILAKASSYSPKRLQYVIDANK